MKRNAEKLPAEVGGQDCELDAMETPHRGNGVTAMSLPSASQAPRPRPEIAVLGWNVRSYRLSLRVSKA